MNRLIRIALTLFASATVLILLIRQRALRLQKDLESVTGELANELAKQEGQMIAIGILLAGLLAAGGFVLVIIAIARGRKPQRPHEG
ncbi:hypothetical protein HAHE_34220 [Haloferula helveola]|uniref:DUF3185 family protein n=1 Tax=Haloferula helveola TaxID=490095 RepID=A0ABN6HD34_9BACT|nr:hypothetical protein HAHE_34220 [Haloferula helveola]